MTRLSGVDAAWSPTILQVSAVDVPTSSISFVILSCCLGPLRVGTASYDIGSILDLNPINRLTYGPYVDRSRDHRRRSASISGKCSA